MLYNLVCLHGQCPYQIRERGITTRMWSGKSSTCVYIELHVASVQICTWVLQITSCFIISKNLLDFYCDSPSQPILVYFIDNHTLASMQWNVHSLAERDCPIKRLLPVEHLSRTLTNSFVVMDTFIPVVFPFQPAELVC